MVRGARGAWTEWRSAPGSAALSGGRGGGWAPLAWRGGTGPTSLSLPPAFRGLGGGRGGGLARTRVRRRPPSAPWFISLAAAGVGLKSQDPPAAGFFLRLWGRLGDAWATRSLLGAGALPRARRRASRRWGVCGRVASCAPPCNMLGQGCLASLGTRRGPRD